MHASPLTSGLPFSTIALLALASKSRTPLASTKAGDLGTGGNAGIQQTEDDRDLAGPKTAASASFHLHR
jgi:hypothetical protein